MRANLLLGRIAIVTLMASASRSEAQTTEEGSLDDLDLVKLLNVEVSTATKTAESLEDAPAIMTVVTRQEIARWGYQSVAEVLNRVVGFYLIDDHILPDVGVRGMSGGLRAEGGMIKVMIDGRSVAYRTTSGNWLGVELIPLGSVKQIEIIRGPASALYGADAFLGVVNIITLDPEDVRPLRVRVAGGVTETNPGGRVDAVGGGKFGAVDVLLGIAGEMTDRSGLSLPGESPAPTLPSDIGERRVAQNLERRSLVLQGRVGLRDKKTGQVVVSAYGSGFERGGDFAQWAQLTNGVDSEGRDRGTTVALEQVRVNLDALLHVMPSLDLSLQGTYYRGGLLPADRIEIASDVLYIERNQRYTGFDSAFEARWVPDLPVNAIVGVETVFDHEELRPPLRVSRDTGDGLAINSSAPGSNVNLFNFGTYLSVNAKLWDPWLKLTGGVRYDNHSQYGDQVAGRVGTTSRLTDDLVLKLLYGSAFKAPTPYLLYATPLRPGDVVGSPSLEPQLIHTVESQATFSPGRFFSVSSGVSHSWLQDKAEFTAQGINQAARNVASQRSLSWESRVDFRHYDDVSLYGSFERVWSVREIGREGYIAGVIGTENVVYPDWVVRAGAAVGVPSHPAVPLEVGSEVMVVGERRSADTSIVENGGAFQLAPYMLLDAFIATREVYVIPGQETRFALRGRNLLLERGPDPGPAGFEYPLRPGELFLEIEHLF
jgi:outer membrane receptor for ferrienterochelin and colicins